MWFRDLRSHNSDMPGAVVSGFRSWSYTVAMAGSGLDRFWKASRVRLCQAMAPNQRSRGFIAVISGVKKGCAGL